MSIIIIDEIHLNTNFIVGFVFTEREGRFFFRITTSIEIKVGSAWIKEVSFFTKNAEEKEIAYQRIKDAFMQDNGVFRIIPLNKDDNADVKLGADLGSPQR